MEKIFVMLRVTEEKERNFEKRGYMGKKVLGVLTILLILTGCQNMGNEAENLQQVEKQENGEERNSSCLLYTSLPMKSDMENPGGTGGALTACGLR